MISPIYVYRTSSVCFSLPIDSDVSSDDICRINKPVMIISHYVMFLYTGVLILNLNYVVNKRICYNLFINLITATKKAKFVLFLMFFNSGISYDTLKIMTRKFDCQMTWNYLEH